MKTCLGTVHLLPVHGAMKWQKSLQSAPSRCRSDKEAASPSGGLEVDGEAGSGGPWRSGPGPILHLIRKHMQDRETYASPATRRSLTDTQHMELKGRKRPDADLQKSQATEQHTSEGVEDGGTRQGGGAEGLPETRRRHLLYFLSIRRLSLVLMMISNRRNINTHGS